MASKMLRLLMAVALITAAITAEARLAVKMVQVAHRHGARGPLVTDNATEICGTEYPCGELTGVGIEMLNSIGRYVRARYNDLSVVESQLFPSTRYNSSVVYTRSTGIQRTIQSATAFLRGLFPDDYFYPVVYSHNITTDTLLNTDPVPSVMGRRNLEPDVQNAAMNAVIDEYLTWEQIQAASVDAYIQGLCQDYAQRASCVSNLYDIATSFEASGRLSSKPNLEAAFPGLAAYTTAWYRFVFDYNKSIELDATQGAPSQNLAQTMLANINAHKLSPSFKLYEFSTHDTMVAPLGITFGDHTDATMRPPYGITIIVELLQDTESTSDYYVRLLRGAPTLLANGSYEFQLTGMQVHCLDAAGNQYLASTGVCPLDSFRRMVDYSRPTSTNGQCTMSDAQYANLNCPRTIAANTPVPSNCWIYRYVCSETACPTGYVLARTDYQCYPNGDVETSSTTTTTTTTTAAPASSTTTTTTTTPAPTSTTTTTTTTPAPTTTTTTTTSAAPQSNTAMHPIAWTPKLSTPMKGSDVALHLLRGGDGIVLGTALRQQKA